MNDNKKELIEGVVIIGLCFLVIWICQLLWNAIIPQLFNGPQIRYRQVLGLWILIRLMLPGGRKED